MCLNIREKHETQSYIPGEINDVGHSKTQSVQGISPGFVKRIFKSKTSKTNCQLNLLLNFLKLFR